MLKNNSLILLLIFMHRVYADIATDGSLGNKLELIGPHYQIDQALGQVAGQNLFHSFEHFSLNAQESATFSSYQPINNVISRVTGGQTSWIDGKIISTIPNANFYFLNPAGLLFGENAKLDISGALHVTTADTLYFSDDKEFNVRYPNYKSTLSTASPTAFGFLTASPAAITINSQTLYANDEKTLSIIGGDILIDKGAGIRARSGRINIASIANKGRVIPTSEDLIMTASGGNLMIQDESWISSSAKGDSQDISGDIYIRSGEFVLQNSTIRADTRGQKQGGKIEIHANNFTIRDGGELINHVYGEGDGGGININTTGQVDIIGYTGNYISSIRSNVGASNHTTTTGNAGDITIIADNLSIRKGAIISGSTYGLGKGSFIHIEVNNEVLLNGNNGEGQGSDIGVDSFGQGEGGTIFIKAAQLTLRDGAQIGAAANAIGNSGNVIIQLSKDALFSGISLKNSRPSGILVGSYSNADNAGEAGQLVLNAKRLILEKGAKIGTQTQNADGGDIFVNLDGYLYLMASKLTSTVNDNTGDGGKVILTPKFIVLDDSTILAEAEEGKGGTIGIDAFGVYTFSPSTISAQSKSGEDGTVTISSPDIDIAQGLVILPATFLEADELLKPMCQYASDQKSSLTVRSYSGSPTLPIDWQGSHLLPLLKIYDNQ